MCNTENEQQQGLHIWDPLKKLTAEQLQNLSKTTQKNKKKATSKKNKDQLP